MIPALILAAVLTFSFLGAKSFWLDEALGLRDAQLELSRLWWVLQHDPNMSLYRFLHHFWLTLGVDEWAARSLSASAAIASIVPFFLMCRGLFGRPHAVVASALLAVNAFYIHYAQEARSYSMVLLLVTASSALFLRALAKAAITDWVAYIVVGSLAVYAHFFAADVVLFYKTIGRVPFEYYARRSDRVTLPRRLLLAPAGGNTQEWVDRQSRTSRRLWLILSHVTDLGESSAYPVIPGGYSRRAERSFVEVHIILYAR